MITTQQLRDLYLADLQMEQVYGNVRKPKGGKIKNWKNITSETLTGQPPIEIDIFGPKRIFMWSDLHIGHKNIIGYCQRPYASVSEMNDSMISNYLEIITDDDIVIFGGDVGFMRDEQLHEIIAPLPGYKILIIGNHDLNRDGKVKKFGMNEQHLCLSVDVDRQYQLLFTHYPMDIVPHGTLNVHGHIHNKKAKKYNFNISVEHTNYKPIPIAVALEVADELL